MAGMKQIGFTLMLFVIVLSPLAAACQQGSESSTVLLKFPVLESCTPLDPAQPVVAGAQVGASQASSARPPGTSMEILIPQDTKVELRLLEGLSTATDHKGYVAHFAVASDVVAKGCGCSSRHSGHRQAYAFRQARVLGSGSEGKRTEDSPGEVLCEKARCRPSRRARRDRPCR